MLEPVKLSLLCAFSVFSVLISVSGVALSAALAAGAVAGAVLYRALRHLPRALGNGAWEVVLLAMFVPLVFVFVTTPGADAAMYAAQARALLNHSSDLSVAYPGVHVEMYPRGFPGLIALFEPIVGMAKASLLAAVCAYMAFTLGLAWWLQKVVPTRTAFVLGILLTVLSRYIPLGFFSWGGNPTVFGFGMAIAALSLAADADRRIVLISAAIVLAGAYAVHPIGAFAGTACAPLVLLLPRFSLSRVLRVSIIGLAIAPLLLCFKVYGPVISPAEAQWITSWQKGPAFVINNQLGVFPLDYLSTFSRLCGDTYAVTFYVCAGILLLFWREQRRLVIIAALGFVYIALLMLHGPFLPQVGTFIYADRLTPMWMALTAPVIAVVADRARTLRWAKMPGVQFALVAALLLIGHARWHLGDPLLTADELALMPCIEAHVGKDEAIVTTYGQGGQWIPALIDRRITQAHMHCTLFDEVDVERQKMRAHFQFLSSHGAQYGDEQAALPATEILCENNGARLVRLSEDVPAGPGVF